ncbi:hypothetical protein MASR1M46_19880 [Bacteroidales bacterium]
MHIDLRFLKPFDEDAVLKAATKCKRIITVEDGTILGGLYSAISEFVASRSLNVKVEGRNSRSVYRAGDNTTVKGRVRV